MKCLSCGGENPPVAQFCQFCGISILASQGALPSASSVSLENVGPIAKGDAGSSSPNFLNDIMRIRALPTNPFRWLAFLFSVPYLAGYGNTKEAIRTAVILCCGYAISFICRIVGLYLLASLVIIAVCVFNFYYIFVLARRADSLVRRDMPFNWPLAIGYGFAFWLVVRVLTYWI